MSADICQDSLGRKGINLSAIIHSCMCNKSFLVSVCFVSFLFVSRNTVSCNFSPISSSGLLVTD